MAHTIKHMAALAGISERTLRYYDEIGLLKPAHYGTNGYRYYDHESALTLQQILFFRELGLSLSAIKDIINNPEFDRLAALQEHREELTGRVQKLNRLINTIDKTILHLKGEAAMRKVLLINSNSEILKTAIMC